MEKDVVDDDVKLLSGRSHLVAFPRHDKESILTRTKEDHQAIIDQNRIFRDEDGLEEFERWQTHLLVGITISN